jgi:uncharacterized protein (TIGR02145 family)
MKKIYINIIAFFLLAAIVLILNNCMENDIQEAAIPELTTLEITGLDYTTATTGGDLAHNGGAEILECGVVYALTDTPTVETNAGKMIGALAAGSFICTLNGLTPETIYNLRAYARNSVGVAYGNMRTFFTAPQIFLSQLTTAEATEITLTTAISGGHITDTGGAAITECGVVYSTSPGPDVDNNLGKTVDILTNGSFTSSLSNLTPGTTYILRAYARNSTGVAYGNEIIFNTKEPEETVTDIDGNIYHTVKIGNQTWMVENLKVTRYTDGTPIPHVTSAADWIALGDNDTDAAWCYYNNGDDTYGVLYTWAAAKGNICPPGWHIPTDAEWKELEIVLGMDQAAADATGWRGSSEGSKLAGNADLWAAGNLESFDQFGSSGFMMLPGGLRNATDGTFSGAGSEARWWSGAVEGDDTKAWRRRIASGDRRIARVSDPKSNGYSIRLIKD